MYVWLIKLSFYIIFSKMSWVDWKKVMERNFKVPYKPLTVQVISPLVYYCFVNTTTPRCQHRTLIFQQLHNETVSTILLLHSQNLLDHGRRNIWSFSVCDLIICTYFTWVYEGWIVPIMKPCRGIMLNWVHSFVISAPYDKKLLS